METLSQIETLGDIPLTPEKYIILKPVCDYSLGEMTLIKEALSYAFLVVFLKTSQGVVIVLKRG